MAVSQKTCLSITSVASVSGGWAPMANSKIAAGCVDCRDTTLEDSCPIQSSLLPVSSIANLTWRERIVWGVCEPFRKLPNGV